MSDSENQVTKKKQKLNDNESAMVNDSNQSTQRAQELGDIIIGPNNDQGASNPRHIFQARVNNTAAQRNRLYRERHREEINQRLRDKRHRQKNSHQNQIFTNAENIDEIEQIAHATSNNQLSSNSHNQSQKRYYERNKEEINKHKRNNRIQKNIPLTSAERSRNYHERNRQKINERRRNNRRFQRYVQQIRTEYDINYVDAIEQIAKATPKISFPNNIIMQKIAHFLFLSETWRSNEKDIEILNFDCIVNFKRKEIRPVAVAIYSNKNITQVTMDDIELIIKNTNEVYLRQATIGAICACEVKMDDGKKFLMVIVYISPNQKVTEIIKFLHRHLLMYSREGSRILEDNLDELPMILTGDFNVNFATKDSIPLTTFLEQKFDLKINNKPTESTSRYGTINAVFSRYIDNMASNTFVTYFTYHRPIISSIPSSTSSTVTITEITEETSNNNS